MIIWAELNWLLNQYLPSAACKKLEHSLFTLITNLSRAFEDCCLQVDKLLDDVAQLGDLVGGDRCSWFGVLCQKLETRLK
jgi:hypothetical protein